MQDQVGLTGEWRTSISILERVKMTKLNINISADDETHGSVSGMRVSLYLIPAEETDNGVAEVVTFAAIGGGYPFAAAHGRQLCLGDLPVNFCADSLAETLESQRDKLENIAASYLGSEWDGSNHRGRWDEDALYIEINRECESYWPADEWLCGDWPSTELEMLEATSLRSMAENVVDNASGTARLDLDDVLDCLTVRAKELLEEKRDELAELASEDETDEIIADDIVKLSALTASPTSPG